MNQGFFPNGRRAALSLSFDDARATQLDYGIPLLDSWGVRATFYVVPSNLAPRADEWRHAHATGHELGNHSLKHPCTGNFSWSRERALENYTLAQMESELNAASDAIEQLAGVRPRTFAYPCGQTFVGRGVGLNSYIPLVARLFSAGRCFMGEVANDPRFCDPAQLFAFDSDCQDFDRFKTLIDAAIADGSWLVFAGHDMTEAGRQTTRLGVLEQVFGYCRQRESDIWVDTIANVASHVLAARCERGKSCIA